MFGKIIGLELSCIVNLKNWSFYDEHSKDSYIKFMMSLNSNPRSAHVKTEALPRLLVDLKARI